MNLPSLKTVFKSAAAATGAALPAAAMAAPGAGLAVGAMSFGAPWALAGLAALPALWWLMRSIPPKPLLVKFPAMNILFNLKAEDQQPAKMPWWQYLLRTTAVAAAIVGLAQPQWNPQAPIDGTGPVMSVIDNGWAAGRNWEARKAELNTLIDRAERSSRPLFILPTAPAEDGTAVRIIGPIGADEARALVKEMKPQSYPTDHDAALKALEAMPAQNNTAVVWLSDGLDDAATSSLARELTKIGKLTVVTDDVDMAPRLLVPPDGVDENLSVTLRRLNAEKEETLRLSAGDESGHVINKIDVTFKAGEHDAKGIFKLPSEIRSQIARVTIDGDNSAGSIVLIDERWRRRPVGVVSNAAAGDLSLLSESSYVEQAIGPYVDLHLGSVDSIMKEKMAVIVLGDNVALSKAARESLEAWVDAGGTLLRFAGPNLASQEKTGDKLLPVELRSGSRAIGGSLTGGNAGRIAPFESDSPFFGLKFPDNITIDRQVLARPDVTTNDAQIWARLQDGSPLVSAKALGKGRVVLVHTTANRDWSNLALSGLFVDMLRTVVAQSSGVEKGLDNQGGALPAIKTLDGFGQFRSPAAGVKPLTKEGMQSGIVSPYNPPGFYGNESVRQAHNLAGGVAALKPLQSLPKGTTQLHYDSGKGDSNLSGIFLASAMSLMLLDILVLLGQRRMLPFSGGQNRREKAKLLDNSMNM